MIGIIAAMNVEMESLRSYIQNPVTETISGITFVSGTLEGSEVVTAVCGIGKVFAAMCAQTMILRYKPDCTQTGVIASGDQFISSSERKSAIVETFGAIACEMEGASIGQVCYVNRVPFCVLRAISDSADGSSHMDYPTFVGMAAEQSVKLLCMFLKN